jgi:hypothetical protein
MQFATEKPLVLEADDTSILNDAGVRTPEELANIVSLFASSPEWMDRVRLRTDGR